MKAGNQSRWQGMRLDRDQNHSFFMVVTGAWKNDPGSRAEVTMDGKMRLAVGR